jgi:hypothetical protein
MSKIALSGNANGSGTFTIASPNSNSDRILNLPDSAGTLATLGSTLTRATAVTASGASVDFTSIPSWVKRITVMFYGISTNGSADVQVLLGTSAGVEATGYLGNVANQGTSSATYANLSTGFDVTEATAASVVFYGQMVINNITGNTWTATGQVGRTDNTFLSSTQGGKALAGLLDRVRVTTSNGTDAFDAGTINIIYEG